MLHVTLKDKIVAEGYLAYYSREDNPYDKFLMYEHHELWEEGFDSAWDEELMESAG